MKAHTSFWAAGTLAAALLMSSAAQSAPAYIFATAPTGEDTSLSLGFTFTALSNITVSSLAYYDFGGDGFLTAHEVGIFDTDGAVSAGTLLTSTILAAGTSGALGANNFRYQAITPIDLIAGHVYTIAGTSPNESGNDPFVYGGPGSYTGFVTDPTVGIGPDAARFTYTSPGSALVNPSDHFSDYQFYAVNFDVSGADGAIPEPAAWALMLLGFFGLGQRLRSARRSLVLTRNPQATAAPRVWG